MELVGIFGILSPALGCLRGSVVYRVYLWAYFDSSYKKPLNLLILYVILTPLRFLFILLPINIANLCCLLMHRHKGYHIILIFHDIRFDLAKNLLNGFMILSSFSLLQKCPLTLNSTQPNLKIKKQKPSILIKQPTHF